MIWYDCSLNFTFRLLMWGRLKGACKAKLNGVRDELKHIDREIRQIQPELRKVRPHSAAEAFESIHEGYVGANRV